ncbi:nucleotidyltransferase family protein [Candidatus Micrarchaeota archaeon]|nr:nucleotidyltransferase family protein [Candidatus Micrarchaeota archaeon]
MKTLKEIKQIMEEQKEVYRKQYKVKELSLFGSYVRKEQKETSDLDILVEFEKPVSLLHLVSFENYLTDILEVRVDLVPKKNLRKEIKEVILKEAIPV